MQVGLVKALIRTLSVLEGHETTFYRDRLCSPTASGSGGPEGLALKAVGIVSYSLQSVGNSGYTLKIKEIRIERWHQQINA
jgi:hypothetical protein